MSMFEIKATWKGGLDGSGALTGEGLESIFSVPKKLNGQGLGTNPEELFLGAASTCFLITAGAVLSRMKVPFVQLEMHSDLEVEVGLGLDIRKIIHRPTVTLEKNATPETLKATNQALAQAEQYCMIAKAVKGNVGVEVVATITE